MGKPRTPKGRAKVIHERLIEMYPEAECELDHTNAFELLVATILSAQCTDKRVNEVTPALFRRYPTPEDLAAANPEELSELIRPTGFFNAKTNSLLKMSERLVSVYRGEVPESREDLVTLAGVGRKTANVVRSVALGLPGLPVDTHVGRLALRLALTKEEDPVKVETELCGFLPPAEWGNFSLRLILHGRRVCAARKPACSACAISDICPSAGK